MVLASVWGHLELQSDRGSCGSWEPATFTRKSTSLANAIDVPRGRRRNSSEFFELMSLVTSGRNWFVAPRQVQGDPPTRPG